MKKILKAALAINFAAMIRFLRFGFKDGYERLAASYYRVDPFGKAPSNEGVSQRRLELEKIPTTSFMDSIKSRPVIKVDSTYSYFDGSLPWNDIVPLLAILVDRSPKVVLEIGTFNGHTTRLFALNLPSSTIHTVDLPPDFSTESDSSPLQKDDFHLIKGRNVGNEHRSDKTISNVIQHFGDSANWDFSTAAGATFYFIDGSHTYDYAKSDTRKALESCQGRRATLVWHDVDNEHPDVVRWMNDLIKEGYAVKRISGTNLCILDQEGISI